MDGEWRWWPAAVSIGVRPTFVTGRGVLIEAYLIGFDGDCYDRELRLDFLAACAARSASTPPRRWSSRCTATSTSARATRVEMGCEAGARLLPCPPHASH